MLVQKQIVEISERVGDHVIEIGVRLFGPPGGAQANGVSRPKKPYSRPIVMLKPLCALSSAGD